MQHVVVGDGPRAVPSFFYQYIRINTMRQYLLSIPMILLLLVGAASAQTVNFSLRGLDGNTYSASEYRGKVLILAVFGYG